MKVGDQLTLASPEVSVSPGGVRLGALQAGGFTCLDESTIEHLLGRPDEKYRQQVLA